MHNTPEGSHGGNWFFSVEQVGLAASCSRGLDGEKSPGQQSPRFALWESGRPPSSWQVLEERP